MLMYIILQEYRPSDQRQSAKSAAQSQKGYSNSACPLLVAVVYHYNDIIKWRDGVSNHQPHECLLQRFFKAQIKENIKLTQRANYAENISIWKCFGIHFMTSSCTQSPFLVASFWSCITIELPTSHGGNSISNYLQSVYFATLRSLSSQAKLHFVFVDYGWISSHVHSMWIADN